ncbi:hypothetical protein KAW64_07770, partial [bacterium]|nr:hypothetical protein [bacterium]
YADRRAIVDRAYEEELAVLEQKRGLLDQITDPGHAGPDSPMHARALHSRLGPPCAATPAQDAQLTRSTAPIILLDVRL